MLEEVLIAARTGPFMETVDAWLRESAVAHLVAWRVVNVLAVDVRPQDCVVAGGLEATVWLYERFAHTYLSEWSSSSLEWELSFNIEPARTALGAGVAIDLIKERRVPAHEVLTEIVERHTKTGLGLESQSYGGAGLVEVLEQVVRLAQSGDVLQAQGLARGISEKFPSNATVKNVYAFLLIPTDPDKAMELLRDPDVVRLNLTINSVNHASCLLAKGLLDDCASLVNAIVEGRSEGQDGWFWAPESLTRAIPWEVRHYDVTDWLAEASRVTRR